MQTLTATLQSLTIGEPQAYRNLTAFPLLRRNAPKAAYLTLSAAVAKGAARITEISAGGSVPELLLDNTGADNVLILDGEELLGAKQNRIANLTILAAAYSKTVIPVSCVEAGRWSYRSAAFDVSERAQFARGRALKAEVVSRNMKATGTYGADQGMVWDAIASKQSRMRVESATAAMADIYDSYDLDIEEYAVKFRAVENQVGVVFAIDGQVEGMDLFDATDTLGAMLPKLARSFAVDALESASHDAPQAQISVAAQFLDRLAAAAVDSYPGVGLGNDIRISAPLVAGGGLVHEDRLVHLAAFSTAIRPAPGARSNDAAAFDTRLSSQRYSGMRQRNRNR